jgi:hypothetical protein
VYTLLLFASVFVGAHFAVALVYILLARRPAAPARLRWLSQARLDAHAPNVRVFHSLVTG